MNVENALERWWALVERMRASKPLFWLMLLPNLAGIVGGYYYYWDVGQFTNPARPEYARALAWWPFIPDSPNAVLLCVIALAAFTFWGKRSRLFDGIAFTAMLYVGVWTTFLFLAYPEQLGTFHWGGTNNLLFVSHMGMPLEALLLVPALRKDKTPLWVGGAVVGWNLLNLWLDYGPVHLHPAPFLHDQANLPPMTSASDALLHTGSLWIMAAVCGGYLWVSARARMRNRPN